MAGIESFEQLFAAAKAGGYRLEAFREDGAGFFYCRWRHGGVIGAEALRRLPLNAALDAYLECRSVVTEESADRNESDLFG